MSDELLNRLKGIISTHLGVDEAEIKVDSHLKEDLDADPLSIADLFNDIEKEFDINLEQNQTSQISTVGDILNLISDQTGDI